MARPLPTAPDHELHDELLVAQFVAGDRLEPSELGKAELYVNTCGACAALAADLRAVSAAVAWEPTPPRRRDYRLSTEQARELRGNIVSRFLRRALPTPPRTLAPTAAAVMSLGILFVIAGSVWTDGIEYLDGQPLSTPSALDSAVQQDVTAPENAAAPEGELDDAEARFEQTPAEEPAAPAVDSDQLLERVVGESELSLERDAGPAATSQPADAGLDSQLLEAVDNVKKADGMEAPAPMAVSEEQGVEAAAGESPEAAASRALRSQGDGAGPGDDDPGANPDAATADFVDDEFATVTSDGAASAVELETMPLSSDEPGGPDWLILVGAVLAVVGAAILLFAWLARRSADPLVR